MKRRLLALAVALSSWLAHASEPASLALRIDDPRPFGYAVGDLVIRHVTLELESGAALDREALPKPGRVNSSLELRSANLRQHRGFGLRVFELDLIYQIMKAPQQVETLNLPEVGIKLAGEAKPTQSVPAWPITVAPLTPEYVLASHGLEEMRPSTAAPHVRTGPTRARMWLYGAALLGLLLAWLYRKYGVSWIARYRGPFARAYRAAGRADSLPELARLLHQAFNQTAGRTVIAPALEEFFAQHPRFAALGGRIHAFFAESQRAFFAAGEANPRLEREALLSLARDLRDRERGAAG